MPRQPHDRYFKSWLEAPDTLAALLRAALPALAGQLGPEQLSLGSPALVGRRRARTPDLLVRVALGRGVEAMVLIEHQTEPDPSMPLRLAEEAFAVCRRSSRERGRRPLHLSPVLALVVYQGRRPWRAPVELRDVFRVGEPAHEALLPWLPGLRYALLDLHPMPVAALPDHPGLRLGFQLLRHAWRRDPWPLLLREGAAVRAILEREGRDRLLIHLDYAAEIAATPPPPGFARELSAAAGYPTTEVFMSYAATLRKEGRLEGWQEGRQEGRQEGQQLGRVEGLRDGQLRLLRRQIERRFGPLPAAVETRLQGATPAQLEAWADGVLEARSLDDLLDRTP